MKSWHLLFKVINLRGADILAGIEKCLIFDLVRAKMRRVFAAIQSSYKSV